MNQEKHVYERVEGDGSPSTSSSSQVNKLDAFSDRIRRIPVGSGKTLYWIRVWDCSTWAPQHRHQYQCGCQIVMLWHGKRYEYFVFFFNQILFNALQDGSATEHHSTNDAYGGLVSTKYI